MSRYLGSAIPSPSAGSHTAVEETSFADLSANLSISPGQRELDLPSAVLALIRLTAEMANGEWALALLAERQAEGKPGPSSVT